MPAKKTTRVTKVVPAERLRLIEIDRRLERLRDAAEGKINPDQQALAEEVLRMGDLLLSKNLDYGSSAWQRPILAPECNIDVAIRVRMSDKINRLKTLLEPGTTREVQSESILDTFTDLANYVILMLANPHRDR